MMRMMTNLNLWGEVPLSPVLPVTTRRKKSACRGRPGDGPDGTTCGGCKHAWFHTANAGKKRYWKCGLVHATHGLATDIRVRTPSCEFFERSD